jgi:3-oxoadipate enol-lactonase
VNRSGLAKTSVRAQVGCMGAIKTSFGNIGVDQQGVGDATPIVFLHGVGSDKSVWTPQLEHFGKARRAIACDYPGYGESDPAPAGCTRDDFAAAILEALSELQVERAHVCGLSLGGVIAIAMHHAAPERCASLVLADTFAVHPEGQAIYDRSVTASQSTSMRSLAEQRAPMLLAPDATDQLRLNVVATMGRIDPDAYRIGARAVWLADQRDRAAAIRAPTLVLVGDLDPVTPPTLSEELTALVPGARLEVIAGASHISNLDRPIRFNRLVQAFISGVESDL